MSKNDRLRKAEARFAESMELMDRLLFRGNENELRVPIDPALIAKKREELLTSANNYEELLDMAALKAAESELFKQTLVEYERGLLLGMLDNSRMQKNLLSYHAQKGNLVCQVIVYSINAYVIGKSQLNAKRRLKSDPKADAKIKAKELWLDWQEGRTLHEGKAAWARYVQSLYPVLKSTKNIEDWGTDWAKEKRKHSAS